MCNLRDITQRKKAERELHEALRQQKELSDLKSRFISVASHEFRTPLATISATAETLLAYRERMEPAEVERRLHKIAEQVAALSAMVEDTLTLTRIQAGRLEMKPELTDFVAFCRQIVDEFQNRPDIQHPLKFSAAEKIPSLSIDRNLMRQVVVNLVHNAIKYSPPEKSVTVEVAHEKALIVLRVSDEGIGIPPADHAYLFDAFHRAGNVGTISGTGLGLHIARQAVELHQGHITFASRPRGGTVFVVSIPLEIQKSEGQPQ